MKTWARHIWESLLSSYWFVPSIMIALAAALAVLTLWFDHTWELSTDGWYLGAYTGGPEGARALLASIAGSAATVAGVAFSITIATLTQASSQFGPRLLRNFVRDRGNQIVLGTFTATFIYCILVVRAVRGENGSEFVPNLSVTVGVMLAVASIGVLIYFIHHTSRNLQAPIVIATAAGDLRKAVENAFCSGDQDDDRQARQETPIDRPPPERSRPIRAARDGYLQAVDEETLIKLACERDLLLTLTVRPGKFVMKHGEVALAYPSDRCDDELAARFSHSFIIGAQPTEEQDIGFAILQLVEIACRAVSPAINDPFTAMECVDWLSAAICEAADGRQPPTARRDDRGEVRLIAPRWNFEAMVDAAFSPIRQNARQSVLVMDRLLEQLTQIARRVRTVPQREAIARQLTAIEQEVRHMDIGELESMGLDQRRRALRESLHFNDEAA